MEHRIGNLRRVKFIKSFYTYNQPPFRVYYRTRNIVWFIKEYREDKELHKVKIKELITDSIRIFFEDDSIGKYKQFVRGLKDGIKLDYRK